MKMKQVGSTLRDAVCDIFMLIALFLSLAMDVLAEIASASD